MNNEWHTPKWLIDDVRRFFSFTCDKGIDLDMASNSDAQKIVKASNWNSLDDLFDFELDYIDFENRCIETVWCNPPYSAKECYEFCNWMSSELGGMYYTHGLLLIPNATETKYFQAAQDAADAIMFSRGRIKFVNRATGLVETSPRTGHALLYYGSQPLFAHQAFKKNFWVAR